MIAKTDTIDADELLIERIKAGDMAAYNLMVIRHYDRIFSRVLQLLNIILIETKKRDLIIDMISLLTLLLLLLLLN